LDDMISKFRKLGTDIRKLSKADAPEPIGNVKLEIVNDQIQISIVHKDAVVPESKLDKASAERLKLVKTKITLLHKRLASLRKHQGLENATFKLGEKDKTTIQLSADKAILEKNKEEDDVIDMGRSITKFNNRTALLDVQLSGNVTLAQCVSALLATLKDELKKRGEKLRISVENGVPEITGFPETAEEWLPDLVARAWNLFKSLLAFLKDLNQRLATIIRDVETAITDGAELPGRLKSAAESANLGPSDLFKATKATHANLKALGTGPTIAKTLSSTTKDTLLEIAGVFTSQPKEEDE